MDRIIHVTTNNGSLHAYRLARRLLQLDIPKVDLRPLELVCVKAEAPEYDIAVINVQELGRLGDCWQGKPALAWCYEHDCAMVDGRCTAES